MQNTLAYFERYEGQGLVEFRGSFRGVLARGVNL